MREYEQESVNMSNCKDRHRAYPFFVRYNIMKSSDCFHKWIVSTVEGKGICHVQRLLLEIVFGGRRTGNRSLF